MTAADYAAVSERRSRRAACRSHVPLDGELAHGVRHRRPRRRRGGGQSASKTALRRHLERFRMAGYDLEVDAPRFVPLDL